MSKSPFDLRSGEELRRFAIETLVVWMERLEGTASGIPLRVPRLRGEMRLIPGMHFHLRPELFLQLSGETLFRFPEEEQRVGPGEICLVPRGIPHGERVRGVGEPFLNLVALPGEGVNLHLARESRKGYPGSFVGMQVENVSPGYPALLDEVVRLAHSTSTAGARGARAALAAALATLLVALEGDGEGSEKEGRESKQEPFKVMQARQWCLQLLHDPGFSVAALAARLQCNADYLSQLFRRSTGVTLQGYIHELRLQRATELLHSTLLNVAEVSQAVGFRDPGYFARAFRKWAGVTPRELRRSGGGGGEYFRVRGGGKQFL